MTVERVELTQEDAAAAQAAVEAEKANKNKPTTQTTQSTNQAPSQATQEAPKGRPAGVPEFVPEKFWSAQDPLKAMAESYTSLEQKLGGKGQEQDKSAEQTPEQQQQEAIQKALAEAPKQLQTAVEKASDEFWTTGKLTDETIQGLESLGIPAAFTKQFAESASLLEQQIKNTMYEAAGGEERFSDILKWAGANLPKEQIDAINTIFANSQDVNEVRHVVLGLAGQYGQANGFEPTNRITGGGQGAIGDVFRSEYEVVEAMKDKRYGKDKAYTKSVEDKLGRSNEVFNNFRSY